MTIGRLMVKPNTPAPMKFQKLTATRNRKASVRPKLALPPFLEHLRDEIEPALTPLRNPREVAAGR